MAGWPVYTERFLAVSGQGVWGYYTVPSGHRAVITSLVFSNSGTTAGYSTVTVAGVVLYRSDLATTASSAVQLRAAIYQTEQIGGFTSNSNMRLVASGYLFRLAPGTMEELQDVQKGLEPPGDEMLGRT